MADVNAEIGVNIDTSGALAQLKSLQREIARFHTSVAKSSEAAALAQRDLQRNFLNGVNAIQGFSAELRTVKTTAENFTDSLERNKFSMREYFRYSMASTKTFGRAFSAEMDTVNKVAVENVKRLQTQYIKMGRDANGTMKAIAVMPTQLDMSNLTTQTQLAAQRQAVFNQLVKQGSTNLLNFGKNTQWAGRQLMVGFTLPLAGLGAVAAKTFMDMETAAIKFKKVYGDLFTAPEETQFALESIQMLGQEFTKYGIAVADTVSLAAEAAAAGFAGADLQAQVAQATRLQVLGQVDQQKALETTISLQNAFRISSNELADAINFLNAVENQTVVSLDDITTAIPKAAPIVQELGGDVKDLAFFMAAMKEGGINASEGANALKSGLASLINPTGKAKEMLNEMGIDIDRIVESNVGNLKATVIEFAKALDGLSNLERQRAIEQLFGKFQQARLSALFDNVIRDGNQAARVLDLASASMEDLASLAEKELGLTADSAMNKFRGSVELLKASLAPIGEVFLQILTPILDKLNNLLQWFNGLSDTSKKVIAKVVFYLGGLAPIILMTIGLMANFVANGIKGLMLLRNGFLRLTGQSKVLGEQTQYLTVEQQNAVAAAASLEQSHMKLQQAFTGEAGAVRKLIAEYQRMIAAQNMAATRFPGMMQPGFKPRGYAKGVVSVPGPKGAGDVVPAMVSPGEAIIPAKMAQKYGGLINGMIADNIPGFEQGLAANTRQVPGPVNPNTFVSAHFTDRMQLSSSQIDELLNAEKLSETVKRSIRSSMAAGKSVYAYTDAVIALSYQMNEDLKNNSADVIKLRNQLSSNLEATHTELVRRLQQAGVPEAEIRSAASRITKGILSSLPTSGTMGESKFNQIVRSQYAAEAARNPAVSQAYNEMLEYSTISDPTSRGKGGRLSLPSRFRQSIGGMMMRGGGYRGQTRRRQYGSIIGGMGGTYESKYYAQSEAEKVVEGAIKKAQETAQTKSPSRRTIPIGEDIARGLQVGMANQIDETKAMANKLSSAASGLVNPRTGKPFTQQEIAGLRRVSGTDIKGMVGAAGQTAFLGMPTFPEKPEEDQPTRRRGVRGAIGRGISRVGGAGGGLGLSGLLFGLSMLPGKLGQLAQSIMPVVFGLQALKIVAGVLGVWPTMLAAVGVGLFMLHRSAKKAAEEIDNAARLEAEARTGSAKAIEEYAQFTGRALPSAREFTRNNRQLISASGEAVKRFAEFYGQRNNRSNQIITAAATRSEGAGVRAAAVDVAQRAAIFGLSPADIAANIKAAADLVGMDQVKIKAQVQTLLAPNGQDITKEPLTIKARMEFLAQESARSAASVGQAAEDISKIDIGGIMAGGRRSNLTFERLQEAAGTQRSINKSFAGGAVGDTVGALKQVGATINSAIFQQGRFGSDIDVIKEYTNLQSQIQAAGIQASMAFTQQTESLALLNEQYADGTITQEEYEAGLNASSENFATLGKNTKELITEFDKIDKSGKTSAAALKDLGNQAFGALKKSNPPLFKKVTKSLEDLDQAAQIDIMMGYAQGSLTILDVAKLPALLDKINGKPVEVAIKILADAGISGAAVEQQLRDQLELTEKTIKNWSGPKLGPEAATFFQLQDRAKGLRLELKKIEDSKKVGQAGPLDIDKEFKKNESNAGKLDDLFDKELEALRRKRDALKDVNNELDRQNQYQMKQMDLLNQASKAKISGNFLEAVALQQQSMFEGAKFTRESSELQLDRIIKKGEDIQSRVKDTKKIRPGDRGFLEMLKAGQYESIVPMPTTPTAGFGSKATGFAGSTTTVGGSVYTITMNITGDNPKEIADKVMAKLEILNNKNDKTNKVGR